jgi:glycerol kinase
MKNNFYLVLDVGTTGIKALIFDIHHAFVGKRFKELTKSTPHPGTVEQDPDELIDVAKEVIQGVVEDHREIIGDTENILGMGIATQRETTIVWDSETGQSIHPAILWKDSRTELLCDTLSENHNNEVQERAGLPISPDCSATKLSWILEHAKNKKKIKNLRFGTLDSWMLYNLAEGHPHLTDFTNASRTMLFNIKDLSWDSELLKIFEVPKEILPEVRPSISNFGYLRQDLIGARLPIGAVAGDQQASLYAAGHHSGVTKITYGSSTFIMQIIGPEFSVHDKFITTLAVPKNTNEKLYAVEARVDMGAAQVTPLLGKPGLSEVIRQIAVSIDEYIKVLPEKPDKIIIDGGITQYKGLDLIQKEISGINVAPQVIYNGTGLGIAKMLIDSN